MRRAIYVNLDGLRRDFLTPAWTPHLCAFAARATSYARYRSVFPSATRVVSSTFATGCWPASHGLQGNTMALLQDGQLKVFDAGDPEFLQQKRRITGKSLARPTLAERLADHGGVIVFNNVSPGAAYAHDPDGFGHVYNRAGSFGPGRKRLGADEELKIDLDAAGDRHMTERFCREVVAERRPALAVLWTGEPDHTQHTMALGSPEMLAVVREADRNAGLVIAAVDQQRTKGENILLAIGSDHGHETVTGIVDIDAELIAAGLKAGAGSGDVVAVSNGTSALIYVNPGSALRLPGLDRFLRSQSWAGQVVDGDQLGTVGQTTANGLALAVSMSADDEPNDYGIKGRSLVAKPHFGKPDRLGFGQHGGLSTYEQMPFLMIDGPGFVAGLTDSRHASPVDLAPTILAHLGREAFGLDGSALQESLKWRA
jgi:arylsulfatase A-like enzyme